MEEAAAAGDTVAVCAHFAATLSLQHFATLCNTLQYTAIHNL